MNFAEPLAMIAAILCLPFQAYVTARYFLSWPALTSNLLGYTSQDARLARPLGISLGVFNGLVFVWIAVPFVSQTWDSFGLSFAVVPQVLFLALISMFVAGLVSFATEHHPREPSMRRRLMFGMQALLPALAMVLMIAGTFIAEVPATE